MSDARKTKNASATAAKAVASGEHPRSDHAAPASSVSIVINNKEDNEEQDRKDIKDEEETEKLFRDFTGQLHLDTDRKNSNILMSALSALLGPQKTGGSSKTGGPASGHVGHRKCSAIANTTLFLVDKNENYEWRANVSALDDVFVDPSHPPVKGKNLILMSYLIKPLFSKIWKK